MLQPFAPWEPDKTDVNGQHTAVAYNVLPRADGYGPVRSLVAYSQALGATSGNDSFTKVLLHFDGTAASTTITDDNIGGAAHTWTAAGNAQLTTTDPKFGTASLILDGTGDFVSTPDHANFALGAGDFTVDFWFKCTAVGGTRKSIAGQMDASATIATASFGIIRNTSNFIEARVSNGAAFITVTGTTQFTSVLNTNWNHVALVRTGNILRLFINGAQEGGDVAFAGTVPDSASVLAVGREGAITTNEWLGSFDEFRLSVGTARWTTTFGTPAASYDIVSLGSACRGFLRALRTDGSVAVFAATATDIYLLNNLTLAWIKVSKAGSYSSPPASFHWQAVQFGNLVIFVQPSVNPQVYNLSTSAQFADLGGSPPQAAYVAVVNRFVVLTGLTATPFRIQWSSIGDPTAWVAGVLSSDFQDLPDGGVVRGVAGGEYGAIMQDSLIRRMIYQPGDPRVFSIEKVTEDKGLMAPYSLVRAGTQIFFLAPQGLHAMGATGVPAPIGKEKFDRFLLGDFDTSAMQLIIGASDPEAPRIFLAYKSQSGASSAFDRIICYDYALERGTLITGVSGEFIASLAAPGPTLEGLDAISSSIDALPFSLDDVALSFLPKLAVFASITHRLSLFSGPMLEATIDTQEQQMDAARRVRVRGFRPHIDAFTPGDIRGSIGARETVQGSVVYSTEQPVTTTGECPADVSTRLARARCRVVAGAVWASATGVEPVYTPEGLA